MRKVGYLISMVGLLLVFTVKIGQPTAAPCGAGGCREYGPISVMSGCKISPFEQGAEPLLRPRPHTWRR